METRTTRVAVDLLDAAEAEAAQESRSTREQLDHWIRVGMAVSLRHTAARRRIEHALAGQLPLSALSPEERAVANAELDAAISTTANETAIADELAAEGLTVVTVDDDGHLVERHADGTTTPL